MLGEKIARVCALPEGAAEQFDAFHQRLCAANEHIDLTNVTAEDEALEKHYLDSLTALPYLPVGAKCVDVGTGAGFPGVPLLLARPDLQMTLLDALQKRIAFLTETLNDIGASAECVHARVEDFARERRETYDAALSRAVAPLQQPHTGLRPYILRRLLIQQRNTRLHRRARLGEQNGRRSGRLRNRSSLRHPCKNKIDKLDIKV